jgi:hypothetical protein
VPCGSPYLKQGQIHRCRIDGRTAALSGRGEEALPSVEDPLGRVEIRPATV